MTNFAKLWILILRKHRNLKSAMSLLAHNAKQKGALGQNELISGLFHGRLSFVINVLPGDAESAASRTLMKNIR